MKLSGPQKLNNKSNMPKIGLHSIAPWQDDLKIVITTQEIIEGDLIWKRIEYNYKGTIQPLQAKELMLKPEGERSWKYYQVHVLTDYKFCDVNDILKINNDEYKVMKILDYSRNHYIELHCIKDFDE